VPSMIVLVDLKEGVDPEDYERWVLESYAPAVRELPSVEDWRDYRATGLLGSDAAPPYRYVVTLDIRDLDQLGRDVASEGMQALLSELHDLAEVTQIMAERLA
jgi:REDY-like protein HapK